MNNLAASYRDAGQLDRALPLLEETLKLTKAKLGADHPTTLTSMNNLAAGYYAAGQLDRAVPLWEETLKLYKAKLGADHPVTLATLTNLACAYQYAGRLPEALPMFELAAQGVAKRRFQHEHAQRIIANTIRAYEQAKQFDKAEAWRRQWLPVVKQHAGAESPAYAGELAALGLNLLTQQKWSDAETTLRECLAIREKKEAKAWTTFNTMSMLGGALAGQKKYAEAEPLLLKGYQGMKERATTPGANAARLAFEQRLTQALDRLIALYTAVDKPEEVKKWQAERAKIIQKCTAW
jgi:tetratricopeptide (TPR) repeat protein